MYKLAATVEKSHRSRSKFNNKSARTQPSIITIGWHHCALSPSFLPSLLVTPVVPVLALAGWVTRLLKIPMKSTGINRERGLCDFSDGFASAFISNCLWVHT